MDECTMSQLVSIDVRYTRNLELPDKGPKVQPLAPCRRSNSPLDGGTRQPEAAHHDADLAALTNQKDRHRL